jgi:hypothetical protein
MLALATVLFGLGFLLAIAGGIWELILAFNDHIGWGLASLLLPGAALVFTVMKWSNKSVRKSFLLGILGLLITYCTREVIIFLRMPISWEIFR